MTADMDGVKRVSPRYQREKARAFDSAVRDEIASGASEDQVRWFVYSHILDEDLGVMGAVMAAVRRHYGSHITTVALDNIQDEVTDTLRVAILGKPGEKEPLFNIDLAERHSTVGWAKMFCAKVAVRSKPKRQGVALNFEVEASDQPVLDDDSMAIIERAEEEMKGKRKPARLQLSQTFIQKAFHVPELALPTRRADRDELLSVVKDLGVDVAQEIRSLSAMHTLAPLFTKWSHSEMESFLERGDDLIHTYLLSSLSPRAKPPEHAVSSVKKIVRSASSRPGWTSISVRLVRAWIAEHFAAVTDFDGRSNVQQSELERQEEAKLWPIFVENAILFHGNPLGVENESEMDVRLSEFLGNVRSS